MKRWCNVRAGNSLRQHCRGRVGMREEIGERESCSVSFYRNINFREEIKSNAAHCILDFSEIVYFSARNININPNAADSKMLVLLSAAFGEIFMFRAVK